MSRGVLFHNLKGAHMEKTLCGFFVKVGFYLGYLRGLRASPKNAQLPPPQKKLLSLQYISKCIGKISQTQRGQST